MPHTEASIVELIERSDRAVYKGILAIQRRQTDDEKAGHLTKHTNGVGWSKWDAGWMADMIGKYNQWGSLTAKQMAVTRNKLKRYRRQLLEIALENEAAKGLVQPIKPAEVRPEVEVSGDYNRLSPRCGCESNDGEVALEDCPACLARQILAQDPMRDVNDHF